MLLEPCGSIGGWWGVCDPLGIRVFWGTDTADTQTEGRAWMWKQQGNDWGTAKESQCNAQHQKGWGMQNQRSWENDDQDGCAGGDQVYQSWGERELEDIIHVNGGCQGWGDESQVDLNRSRDGAQDDPANEKHVSSNVEPQGELLEANQEDWAEKTHQDSDKPGQTTQGHTHTWPGQPRHSSRNTPSSGSQSASRLSKRG